MGVKGSPALEDMLCIAFIGGYKFSAGGALIRLFAACKYSFIFFEAVAASRYFA